MALLVDIKLNVCVCACGAQAHKHFMLSESCINMEIIVESTRGYYAFVIANIWKTFYYMRHNIIIIIEYYQMKNPICVWKLCTTVITNGN